MKAFRLKEILIPTVTLTLICAIAACALAFSDALTSEKIAQLDAENKAASMQKVLQAANYQALTDDDTSDMFYAAVDSSGKTIGYVASCSAVGYGGDISVMVGIDSNGTVTAIDIVSCDDETPGLGQKVKNEDFTAQFSGVKDAAVFGENVDAISGATISSEAVRTAVNNALSMYDSYKQEG